MKKEKFQSDLPKDFVNAKLQGLLYGLSAEALFEVKFCILALHLKN